MRQLLNRLGSNPHHSWSWFKRGLLWFVFGALLIVAGAEFWFWLQVPGMLLLAFGFGVAAYGYLGILASRFILSFPPPRQQNDVSRHNTHQE